MQKRTWQIKWKLFLYLIGFCVLMLVILWLFQIVFLDRFYKEIKLAAIEREAENLVQYIEKGDAASLENIVHRRGDMFVEIFDADGNSYTVSDHYPEVALEQLTVEQKQALFLATKQNGNSLSWQFNDEQPFSEMLPPFQMEPPTEAPDTEPGRHDDRGLERILHARIVTTEAGEEKLLLVTANITPVSATTDTLRSQLVYISLIMLVLAVAIALLMAKRVSKPIVQLNDDAKELGKGHYDVHFASDGYREIAELADTLDRAAGELSKTEALRRELIANVSHDLRTPLTLITGYAEMMRDLPGENNAENMQVIIDEANHLTLLVKDLLDLSRIQSQTLEIRRERVNLTGETRAIIERFAKFSEPAGFQITFDCAEDRYVEADIDRIGQVIYNFLVNAMTHGGEEKRIVVRQRVAEGRVAIEVTDSGAGIPAADLSYIWDRYYKVDQVHKRAAAGTGLGLSIVKNVLEQHGDVEYGVRSEVGQGSTFWFSLPVLP